MACSLAALPAVTCGKMGDGASGERVEGEESEGREAWEGCGTAREVEYRKVRVGHVSRLGR